MRVKNPNQVSKWSFLIIDPSGNEVVVPPSDPCNSVGRLHGMVMGVINVYDNITGGEYSKKQRELASAKNMDFEDYVFKLIENQMCSRFKIDCWSEGIGDDIHNVLSKVDDFIEHTPAPVRKVMQAVVAKVTPSKTKRFGSCSSCGGTRAMNPSVDNLGRKDKLNWR